MRNILSVFACWIFSTQKKKKTTIYIYILKKCVHVIKIPIPLVLTTWTTTNIHNILSITNVCKIPQRHSVLDIGIFGCVWDKMTRRFHNGIFWATVVTVNDKIHVNVTVLWCAHANNSLQTVSKWRQE